MRKKVEGKLRGGRKEIGKDEWRVTFWNVAELRNKDRDFRKGLEKWNVIVLSETWVDKKGWERIKDNLPKGYKWGKQLAKRRW